MRTGARIMEDRVSPSSLTASLSKQQRNFGRINFQDKSHDGGENGEAGLAGGAARDESHAECNEESDVRGEMCSP